MAGQLSSFDLSAVAVGNSLWSPFSFFIIGVLTALTPIIGQLHGSAEKTKIEETTQQALLVSLALAIIAILIMQNLDSLGILFNINAKVVYLANQYIIALSWGMPAFFAYSTLKFFQEGIGITRINMNLSILSFLLNLIGNYVFMYGKLGIPALGAEGCGYATSISWWLILMLMIVCNKKNKILRTYNILRISTKAKMNDIRSLFSVGTPIGLSSALEVSLFASTTLIAGRLSVKEIAAHQIVLNMVSITFSIVLGLATAISIKVAQSIAKKEAYQAIGFSYSGILLCMALMTTIGGILYFFGSNFLSIYTEDMETLSICMTLILGAVFFQVPDGLQVAIIQSLRGFKDVNKPFLINFFSYWIIGIPIAYILCIELNYRANGLWIGLVCALVTSAILHFFRLKYIVKTHIIG